KTVNIKPSDPAFTVSVKSIPNPRPTTAILSNQLTEVLLRVGKGCPKKNANRKPPKSATGLLTKPRTQIAMAIKNRTFDRFSLIEFVGIIDLRLKLELLFLQR